MNEKPASVPVPTLSDSAALEGRRVRTSFDRAAASYDQAAALQRRVADRLLVQLAHPAPARIVDAGCGTGYVTTALARRHADAAVFALDLAPAMLQATARRNTGACLVCADVQALPLAPHSIDLFCSSLMLQWCDRLDLAFADIHACLRSGGEFAFSTFGPATLHELRASFADGRSHVSRFVAADDIHALLVTAGFRDIALEVRSEVLHYADAYSLMRELKAIGAHNATAGRARGLTGKRGWQTMLANYEARRESAGLPATYELIYVTARV